MRRTIVLGVALVLTACGGESYSDLESEFKVEKLVATQHLPVDTIVITSQRHRGAESYHGVASVYVAASSVDIQLSVPFTKIVSIPASDIAGCSMTCFGPSDQRVDLLIPKVGADIMLSSGKEVLNWCWQNKKPMFSSEARRQWQFKGTPLPQASEFTAQFSSREVFDVQVKRSCAGY